MKVEDIKKGMTVTVRPAVRGIARFDGVVLGTAGNFVMVQRGEHKEQWAVGAHEVEPYDGLTDFQREIMNLVCEFKAISVGDVIAKAGGDTNEAAVWRAVKRHPLSNYVEVKRLEGKNKQERIAMLYLKESK